MATTAAAVTGPTPGTVHSRRPAACPATPARELRLQDGLLVEGPEHASSGATSRCGGADSASACTRGPNGDAPPLGTRTPSRRSPARSTLM
ncbi:MAG TPA: hypothetical protein VKH82_02545 [Candidatus Binatia bacterium]|nr:hypothetical protein [Candidatus Binatia bacterium]